MSDVAARLETFLATRLPDADAVHVGDVEAHTEGFSAETFSFTAEVTYGTRVERAAWVLKREPAAGLGGWLSAEEGGGPDDAPGTVRDRRGCPEGACPCRTMTFFPLARRVGLIMSNGTSRCLIVPHFRKRNESVRSSAVR